MFFTNKWYSQSIGHAVSDDLLNWTELDEIVLFPAMMMSITAGLRNATGMRKASGSTWFGLPALNPKTKGSGRQHPHLVCCQR